MTCMDAIPLVPALAIRRPQAQSAEAPEAFSPATADHPRESLADFRAGLLAKFRSSAAAGDRVVTTHQKKPVIRWKQLQRRALTKREINNATCETKGVDGYAVITGRNPLAPERSIYARDFDTVEGYEAWAAAHGNAAATLFTVRTSKGYHVYARMPADMPEIFLTFIGPLKRGELKANQGYIVGPGSMHPSGAIYRPVNFPADVLVTDTSEMHPVEAGFLSQEEYDAAVRKATGLSEKTGQKPPTRVKERAPSPEYAELRPLSERQLLRLRTIARKHTVREEGERHWRMWDLLRALKGVSFLADQPPEAVMDVFEYWHARSVDQMRGKDVERNWKDFKESWPAVKTPTLLVLRTNVQARLASGCIPDEVRDMPDSCRRVAVVMAEMQSFVTLLRAQDSFFLSFSLLAELADLSSSTAWDAVQALFRLKMVKLVREGKRCSGGGWAATYEFHGEWPPMGLEGDGPLAESSPSDSPSFPTSMYSGQGVDSDRTESVSSPRAPLTYRPAVSKPPPTPLTA
jgi:hypothetical protein